jgi:hypothetical protein
MNVCVKYSPVTLLPEAKQGFNKFYNAKITNSNKQCKTQILITYHCIINRKPHSFESLLLKPFAS